VSDITDFSTHGQQLLAGSKYSASEIGRLLNVPRQRVSDWRRGKFRPEGEARQAIAKALGIPTTAWDAAPVRTASKPTAQTPPKISEPDRIVGPGDGEPTVEAAAAVREVAALSDADVDALGFEGIAAVIRRLRSMNTLPPREAVSAAVAEGRLHDRLVQLRQKDANARRRYLESREFADDVTLLAGAFRASTAEIRTRLARFGINLPLPEPDVEEVNADPPATVEDVEDLCAELRTARELTEAGEPGLAAAHLAALALDIHGDAIAEIVADRPDLATRVLGLLPEDGPDHRFIRSAVERRLAIRGVRSQPPAARKATAALLDLLGHTDLSREIGA
jgi:transcriptional regulator with XRE-family HTH domain